jgi:hypothetical protein
MLLAAVTVHIFAFLRRISDKPVAPYCEISDFYAGVEKGLIGVCPTYAAGGLMESVWLAGKDALQPERLEGKVLQKLGQPFMQAHERAVLHGDWARPPFASIEELTHRQQGKNTDVRHHVDSSAGEGFRARRSPLPKAIPSQTVYGGCGRPREVLPEMRSPSYGFVLLQSWP